MKELTTEERAEIQKAENVRSVKLYNWKNGCYVSNNISFCCIVSVLALVGLHVYAHVHAHAQLHCIL